MQNISPNFSQDTNRNSYGTPENLQSIVDAVNSVFSIIEPSTVISGTIIKTYIDGSLSTLNSSTNTAFGIQKTYIDGSIATLNASIGKVTKYVPNEGIGLRDASGSLYDLTYVVKNGNATDVSVYLKVAATTWIQWNASLKTLG
jgi:hypothetical protein